MRVNRPQCARVPYSAESLVRVEASWYGRTLRAIPEVLSQVGYQQADHGESLLTSHHCCLGAAEGARPGWVGSSAGALSGLLDSWAEASTAHAARIGDHSYGMHLAAVGFAEMEEHNAAALAAVYPTGGGSARCDGVTLADIERWDPTAIRTVFRPRSTARTAHAPHRRRCVTPWGCSALAVRPPRRHR